MLIVGVFIWLAIRLTMSEASITTEIQLESTNPKVELFSSAARKIIESFYVKKTSTLFITIGSKTNEINEIVGKTITSEKFPLAYVIKNSENVSGAKHRRHFNLFVVDSYDSFQ